MGNDGTVFRIDTIPCGDSVIHLSVTNPKFSNANTELSKANADIMSLKEELERLRSEYDILLDNEESYVDFKAIRTKDHRSTTDLQK